MMTFEEAHEIYLSRIIKASNILLAVYSNRDHINRDSKEYKEALAEYVKAVDALWDFKNTWAAARQMEEKMAARKGNQP
jgi:hypothetical protein